MLDKTINERIAILVKEYRKLNNLTQKDLAEKLFVEPQTVSSWERGIKVPSPETLVQISNLLGISVDYIYRGIDINRQINYPETLSNNSVVVSNDTDLIDKVANKEYIGKIYEVTVYFKYRLYLWKPNLSIVFPNNIAMKVKMGNAFTFYTDEVSNNLKIYYFGQCIDFNYTLRDDITFFTIDTKKLTNGNAAIIDTNARTLNIQSEGIVNWLPRIIVMIVFIIIVSYIMSESMKYG